MRPRLFTLRNALLLFLAAGVFGGLSYWIRGGMPLPWAGVPSTAGKIAFVSDRNGQPDIWMMDGKDGANAAALTSDAAEDRHPVFSPNGAEVAFASANRSGVSPQIFLMDAAPGRRPIRLTNSSSAKSSPYYAPEGHLVYLDAGKVIEQDVTAQDTHAVFPEPDQKNLLSTFVSAGGIEQAVSLDGEDEQFALVMNVEGGQMLLYWRHDDTRPELLRLLIVGRAYRIHVAPLTDGGCIAAFQDGGPLPEPIPVLTPEIAQVMAQGQENPLLQVAPEVKPIKGMNVLAQLNAEGVPQSGVPIPIAIDAVTAAPDGSGAVLTVEGDTKNAGVYYLRPAEQKISRLFDQPAREPALSPDGKAVAFVSGKDIYRASLEGEPDVKNLTGGKGANSAPNWSPAKPKS